MRRWRFWRSAPSKRHLVRERFQESQHGVSPIQWRTAHGTERESVPDLDCEHVRSSDDIQMRLEERLPRHAATRRTFNSSLLQDASYGRAPNLEADVGECSLNPRVAPRGILVRHSDNQIWYVRHHARTPHLISSTIVLLGNQISVPAE